MLFIYEVCLRYREKVPVYCYTSESPLHRLVSCGSTSNKLKKSIFKRLWILMWDARGQPGKESTHKKKLWNFF